MSSAPTIPDTTSSSTVSWGGPVEEPRAPLRLRLKPKAPTTGWVDGGWWPRSRNLAAELPGLLAVLAVRLGRIERVSYQLADWTPTVRRISCAGGVVRFGGYRTQHPDTVDVLAASQRITLLVVPPDAPAQTAHAALMAAGHRGNTDAVETLLRYRSPTPQVLGNAGKESEAAQQRWDLDGGRVYVGV
jgi:hypothetical protein